MPVGLDRDGRQRALEGWLAGAIQRVAPYLLHQQITPVTMNGFRLALVDDLNAQVRCGGLPTGMPYDLSINHSYGTLSVGVTALETELEAADRAVAEGCAIAVAEERRIAADKARAATHPHRARAFLDVGGDPAIDIAGMIEDLHHWRPPPDALGGEEAYGFEMAIADVINYLRTRARRAK